MNSGNLLSESLKAVNPEKSVMDSNWLDLNLLTEPSDTRATFIHAKVTGLSRNDIDSEAVERLGYSKDSVTDWISGRHPVPLPVLKDINGTAKRMGYLCLRASKAKVKVPKLDSALAYFLGVIFGDGHIAYSKRKKGYLRFRVAIQKKRTKYSEFFLPPLINAIFGITPRIYFTKRKSELITILINSKIVSRFFTNLFHFSSGKKSDIVIDFIKKLPQELQLFFVAGLFDTDGGVSGSSFAFCNSSKKTALFVRSFLSKIKIETKFYPQSKNEFKWYLVYVCGKHKNDFLQKLPLKNGSKYASGGI